MVRTPAGATVRMIAEKRDYKSQMGNVMTEAAIDPGFFRDLYVSLGEPVGEGAWAVRVHHKPFVRWLWIGGLLMGLGGVATLADRRYRGLRVPRPVCHRGCGTWRNRRLNHAALAPVSAADRVCRARRVVVAWIVARSQLHARGARGPVHCPNSACRRSISAR